MNTKLKAIISSIVAGVSEFIAHLASMPPEAQTGFVHDLCAVFPPQWSGPIATFLTAVARVAMLYAVIQASHSGPQSPPRNDTVTSKTLPLLLAGMMMAGLTGCVTDSGDPAKDRRGRITNAVATEAAKVAWNFVLNSGENYLSGRNGQNAASASFVAAQTLQSYDGAAGLASIIRAAAGPEAAIVAKESYLAASPKTAAQREAVINSIGAVFQQVANANP